MCDFFSLISDGNGNAYYFNWVQRKKIMAGKIKVESPDSHTSIANFYGFKGEKEDKMNKYEYNPLTKIFKVDQTNTTDDKCLIEKFCRELDFNKVVEPLVIKPIENALEKGTTEITQYDKKLLKKWSIVGFSVLDSVYDSVRDIVGFSVGPSVWSSVRDSLWSSVGPSVGPSVWSSVRDSLCDSLCDIVGFSVLDSVRDIVGFSVGFSVRAYIATFIKTKYKYDFSSAIKLWERGLIPSFDGTTWRLHGAGGKVLYEVKK